VQPDQCRDYARCSDIELEGDSVKKSLVLLLVFGAFVFAQMWPWPGPGRTIDGYTYYVDATAGDDGDAGTGCL